MLAHGLASEIRKGQPTGIARLGYGLAAGMTLLSAFSAVAVLGLWLTDPIGVADAVGTGGLTALFRVVSAFVISVVKEAVRYL
jgi:hypothetical protein